MRKIEARGFKSMGTSLISVPVEKGFVAITGPNGSGKSNLVDAILFALGENSAKTLRAQNLSALIYDGSADEQKPSSARVSLQFDNSDRRIPTDSDSVTISRELKQSGESLYTLNGKHAQRNNLTDLLENALIASRGLNVVLQGMITRISELVPDEKRKLIESMVGISQFDEKKQEALKQLAEADQRLNVAMAKIEEVRDRVRVLEQQRNDQLRLKQLDTEIKWLRAASSSSKLIAARQSLAEKRAALTLATATLERSVGASAENGKALAELEEKQRSLINSAVDAGTAKIEAELGRVSNELNALKRERKEASDFLDRASQILPRMIEMRGQNERNIADKESQINSLRAKIDQADLRRKELANEQAALTSERAALNADFNRAQQAANEVRKQKADIDSRIEAKREEIREIQSKRKEAALRITQSLEKKKIFDEGLSKASEAIKQLETVLSSQSDQLTTLQKSRIDLERLRKKLDAHLELAASIIEKTQTVVTKYDSKVSAMESIAGEEIALSRLETLGEARALAGYLGAFRTKISYDTEYSQAVAALGKDWLNAVLVSDIDALISTMQSAKKLKISKLTAIPLKEVKDFEGRPRKRVEGMIAFATDIIHCEKKFRKVVNFVFGDAVIVDSARSAFLAARNGYRSVTVEGDLFEPDLLAYQRGYSTKYAKLSELLAKQKNYENLRATLNAFRGLIAKRKSSLSSIQQKADQSTNEERDQAMRLSRTEADLTRTKQQLERFAASVDSLVAIREKAETEIRSLETAETEAANSLAEIRATASEIESRLAAMDNAVLNERLSDLNSRALELNSKVDVVASEIMDLNTELTRARGELENSLKPGLELLLQQQAGTESKAADSAKLLEDTSAKLSELEAEFERWKEEERKSLEISNSYKPLLEQVKQEIDRLKGELESTRKEIAGAEKQVYSLGLEIERYEERERQIAAELLIDGFSEPIPTFEGAEELLKGLSDEFEGLKGNVNYLADRNYREVYENYKYSSVRRNELEKERNAIVTFIETIDTEKKRVFMEAFERIDRELRVIFNKITTGAAWLDLENSESLFDGGIFLMVQFPGKNARDSGSVSGGEKTISALSFILAIQAVFPSPFYVFDEVDAHLDSNYSGKLAEILAERSDRSQIIIVSLKDSVVSKAQSVIGVYMPHGSTRIIRYKSPMEVTVPPEH